MNGVWEVKWAKTEGLGAALGWAAQRCAGADRPYLSDVREANQVGDDADGSDEELPAVAEEFGVLVHQGGDEALHRAELLGGTGVSHRGGP